MSVGFPFWSRSVLPRDQIHAEGVLVHPGRSGGQVIGESPAGQVAVVRVDEIDPDLVQVRLAGNIELPVIAPEHGEVLETAPQVALGVAPLPGAGIGDLGESPEPLRLGPQRIFRLLARGDVGIAAAVALQGSVGVQHGQAVGGYPDDASLPALYGVDQVLERFLPREDCEGGGLERLALLPGMQVVEMHPAHQLVRTIAQDELGHITDIGVEALRIHFPGDGVALFGQLHEPGLALAQSRKSAGQLPFRAVGDRSEQGDDAHEEDQHQTQLQDPPGGRSGNLPGHVVQHDEARHIAPRSIG
jgi:hypothetical protein